MTRHPHKLLGCRGSSQHGKWHLQDTPLAPFSHKISFAPADDANVPQSRVR